MKKTWFTPEVEIFGDLATLTRQPGNNDGDSGGGGTGAGDTGSCTGKGCHTGDAFVTALVGFS